VHGAGFARMSRTSVCGVGSKFPPFVRTSNFQVSLPTGCGAPTCVTPVIDCRLLANACTSAPSDAGTSTTTFSDAVEGAPYSRISVSLTCRASLLAGSADWSTELKRMPANGRPSAISRAALRAASGTGCRITKCENRYQNPDVPDGVVTACCHRRGTRDCWQGLLLGMSCWSRKKTTARTT